MLRGQSCNREEQKHLGFQPQGMVNWFARRDLRKSSEDRNGDYLSQSRCRASDCREWGRVAAADFNRSKRLRTRAVPAL